jgi:hydrogenase maturation protease
LKSNKFGETKGSHDVIKNNFQEVILLIGVGNDYRSDDGIGLLVARKIREKQIPFITVKEESGEGASLIEAWQGFQIVILVDAVSSGTEPGTIFRIWTNEEIIPIKFFHYSTHAFSVAEAIELARMMNTLPSRLLVYGIEGDIFTAGVKISSRVKQAANKVIEQIMKEIETAYR